MVSVVVIKMEESSQQQQLIQQIRVRVNPDNTVTSVQNTDIQWADLVQDNALVGPTEAAMVQLPKESILLKEQNEDR
jgi:hypothetical protein